MNNSSRRNILLVYDDRELVGAELQAIVGNRRFGDIIFRRQSLFEHFRSCIPQWARENLVRLRSKSDQEDLLARISISPEDTAICIVAARAGFPQPERLFQLIERLPYAEEDFTDRLYKPLMVFLSNVHALAELWPEFEASPLHEGSPAWQQAQRLESIRPLDLSRIQDFLTFTSGSTATRHFNEVHIDAYYYTKRSRDKRKMRSEYAFHHLVPEAMRPWLIQPFDYKDEGDTASYRMLRYYLADAALQWVHGAFSIESFPPFVSKLLFFLQERPRKQASLVDCSGYAHSLFVKKVEERAAAFLALPEGARINNLVLAANTELGMEQQLARYLRLYSKMEKSFALNYLAIGHGDPCFSNLLYDPQRYLLMLIDPKGAVSEDELWTHPFYDFAKVSHSVLGDYDFINNGLYTIGFTASNHLTLDIHYSHPPQLKQIFTNQLSAMEYDMRTVRLAEASLFLSMLPLHIDHPNKIVAFLLRAKSILDEIENG